MQVYLVQGNSKSPWSLDTHEKIGYRTKRNVHQQAAPGDQIRITLDGISDTAVNLNLRRHSHPVTQETIIEWVSENGEINVTRGLNTGACWYSGSVENEADSRVSLGICHGLSGMIRLKNETLLLEPIIGSEDAINSSIHHLAYSPRISLINDQVYKIDRSLRRKRNGLVDYDEEGNEITNTIALEDLQEYDESGESDQEEDNAIDDDDEAIISDSFLEIEDYDVHLPHVVTVMNSSAENRPDNQTEDDNSLQQPDFDGFSVDKLWDVPEGT